MGQPSQGGPPSLAGHTLVDNHQAPFVSRSYVSSAPHTLSLTFCGFRFDLQTSSALSSSSLSTLFFFRSSSVLRVATPAP